MNCLRAGTLSCMHSGSITGLTNIFIPTPFYKSEEDIVIASVRLSVRPSFYPSVRLSVMLSSPKRPDEIQPNLVV